jgi:hypothetical protein
MIELTNCNICYNNNNIINTSCKHIFCIDCIYKWIKIKCICPCCRSNLNKYEIINDIYIINNIDENNVNEYINESIYLDIDVNPNIFLSIYIGYFVYNIYYCCKIS